jgi:hypothetical protein
MPLLIVSELNESTILVADADAPPRTPPTELPGRAALRSYLLLERRAFPERINALITALDQYPVTDDGCRHAIIEVPES